MEESLFSTPAGSGAVFLPRDGEGREGTLRFRAIFPREPSLSLWKRDRG
jgi:hypothetical protein